MIEDERWHGRVGYFLGALALIHFSYPLSELSTEASAIYVVFYSMAIGMGAYLTTKDVGRRRVTAVMTVLTSVTGAIWAFTSNDAIVTTSLYIFYVIIIINLGVVMKTMWEFIFAARTITQDVLYAGVSFYLLIGNFFTPLYLFLNAIIVGATGEPAFGVHTYEVAITWQRMYYLSFTTLTTLGYGDITPINSFVEPFVLAEATIGVLYVAVLMARLVSLYEEPFLRREE
ncbi:MAG TPA: potassium channel family protein [Anaerolineae bacterium]|nr:potassium channel family protein [Anaerolineae bacterium]